MAKYINMAIKQAMLPWVFAAASCATHSYALAQALVDPTRPPTMAAQAVAEIAPTGGPVLQSVLISPQRVEAIISGKTVRLGDKVGNASVVRIKESEVVLRHGKNLQVLKLFPNIEKKQATSSPRALAGNNWQQ